MKKNIFFILLNFCILSHLVFSGSTCNPPDPESIPQNLDFTNIQVNKSKALPGEEIIISWDYIRRDLLDTQRIRSFSLVINGMNFTERIMGNDTTKIKFIFERPITISIIAKEKGTNRVIDFACDIKLNDNFFFDLIYRQDNVFYPNLGSGQTRGHISFSSFLGIYENPEINGTESDIDELTRDPNFAIVLPRGNSFFGRSFSVQERENFSYKRGSSFPFLDAGFLTTPDGLQFTGIPNCDMLIYAAAVAYGGTVDSVKTETGYIIIKKGIPSFQSVFVTIDYITDNNGTPHLADIHIGNNFQGLVFSVFHGFTLNRSLGVANFSYIPPQNFGDASSASGTFKGSILGSNVTDRAGNPLGSFGSLFITIEDLRYNVLLAPDNNLSGHFIPAR
jgi:hypothetical protein